MKTAFISWLILLLFACDSNQVGKDNRAFIQPSSVTSMIIRKTELVADSSYIAEKTLSKNNENHFLLTWNAAEPKGMCKYAPQYEVLVTLKSGRTRKFRINGSSIKEQNDFCYNTGDSDFGNNLWKNNH